GDEQIVASIVVVITHAARLSPAGAVLQAGALGDIGECAVTIVFEQTAMRLLTLGESFQPPSIHKKNVQPAIVVVIVERQPATRRLQQILILAYVAVNRFDVEP